MCVMFLQCRQQSRRNIRKKDPTSIHRETTIKPHIRQINGQHSCCLLLGLAKKIREFFKGGTTSNNETVLHLTACTMRKCLQCVGFTRMSVSSSRLCC